MENHLNHSGDRKVPRKLILIWDAGASYGLTTFRSNSVDYVQCDIPVKDVTNINTVIGIGTGLHKFMNSNGKEVFFPCFSYNLTQTDDQLFSPQTYHHMHGGYYEFYDFQVSTYLTYHLIQMHIDREQKKYSYG